MTRQNKNIKNRARAKAITAMHLKGEKGPSSTQPKHGKKHTYRGNPALMKSLAEFTRGPDTKPKNALKKVLENAGGAAATE